MLGENKTITSFEDGDCQILCRIASIDIIGRVVRWDPYWEGQEGIQIATVATWGVASRTSVLAAHEGGQREIGLVPRRGRRRRRRQSCRGLVRGRPSAR